MFQLLLEFIIGRARCDRSGNVFSGYGYCSQSRDGWGKGGLAILEHQLRDGRKQEIHVPRLRWDNGIGSEAASEAGEKLSEKCYFCQQVVPRWTQTARIAAKKRRAENAKCLKHMTRAI